MPTSVTCALEGALRNDGTCAHDDGSGIRRSKLRMCEALGTRQGQNGSNPGDKHPRPNSRCPRSFKKGMLGKAAQLLTQMRDHLSGRSNDHIGTVLSDWSVDNSTWGGGYSNEHKSV